MTTPLVDPREAAFWASDPTQLHPPELTQTQPPEYQPPDHRKLVKVAIALAAGFIVMRWLVSRDLQKQQPNLYGTKDEVKRTWRKHAPMWAKLAAPAIRQGYELGLIEGLTQDELEFMARNYAEELGEYLNETSAQALVEGFHQQLGQRWSDQLAWYRVCSAYGLDSQQMQAYVKHALKPTSDDPQFQLLPEKAKNYIDAAIMRRADRLGGHEAWQSMQMGKALAWMSQQNNGTLPIDAQKEWLTAADERVCPQCGPLNRDRVGLREQFQTPDGNKYWAPGIHINCRCDIRLTYPEIVNDPWKMVEVAKAEGDDPYDRDRRGRFAPVEGREHQVQRQTARQRTRPAPPVREREVDPEVERILREKEALADQTEEALTQPKRGLNPFGSGKALNPFATDRVLNPYSSTPSKGALNPFASTGLNPFATTTLNPFAAPTELNPFAPPKPITRHRRRFMILRPDGKYGLQEVPPDGPDEFEGLAPPVPVWTFAHTYHKQQHGMAEIQSDNDRFKIGDVVDFDYPIDPVSNIQEVSIATPWDDDTRYVAAQAAGEYNDIDDWNDYSIQSITKAYNEAWESWHNSLELSRDQHIMRLQPAEVRLILGRAGAPNSALEDEDSLRQRLLFSQEDTAIDHSFVVFMEEHHPDWVDGGGSDSASQKMEEYTTALRENGRYQHVPQVFVIDETDSSDENDVLDDNLGTVILRGKYEVADISYRSAMVAMHSDRPDSIKALRIVYLKNTNKQSGDPQAGTVFGAGHLGSSTEGQDDLHVPTEAEQELDLHLSEEDVAPYKTVDEWEE